MIKRFVLIYLGFAILLSAVLFTGARYDEHARLAQVAASESRYVDVARERAEKDFESAEGDIRIIANMDDLRQYVDSGDAQHRAKVEQFFQLISQGRQHYDQIRFLDANGYEQIRINYKDGKSVVMPPSPLQDKASFNYFRETIRLARNDIYVSALDLNVENGEVELPFKPVIRFATPVFDSAGRKQGVVVLNYIADEMLQHFREAMLGDISGNGMLLNQDGYWLSSPVQKDEWGFMLGLPERTFAHDFPEAWRTISINNSGTLHTAQGLFAYATVRPLLIDEHAPPDAPQQGGAAGGAAMSDITGRLWRLFLKRFSRQEPSTTNPVAVS